MKKAAWGGTSDAILSEEKEGEERDAKVNKTRDFYQQVDAAVRGSDFDLTAVN